MPTAIVYHCTAIVYHCTAIVYHCTAIVYHCTAIVYHCTAIVYRCTAEQTPHFAVSQLKSLSNQAGIPQGHEYLIAFL